ncbi:MAG: c-type cytochrome [Campylobacteraceae bacterium]|jgi:cytochrome c553|nr:c-type cytochrome [Campylobacteraceae bacterium]
MRKSLMFIAISCACTLFAQEEITIKATGEFAKELKELMEKYQTSDVNGSIEIIDSNKSIAQPSQTQDEEVAKSAEEPSDEIVVVDVDETIYDKTQSADVEKKDFSILGVLFGEKKMNADLAHGETLYKKKCTSCHGQNAEKSSYLSARDLIKLPKDEIVDQLKNYRRDSGYGGTSGLIMRVQATMLNEQQMYDIASYIESLKK